MNIFIRKILEVFGRKGDKPPEEYVKLNTREAFKYFFSKNEYIDSVYLSADRIALYELIADYCAEFLKGRLDRKRSFKVIDVGCGTGNMLEKLNNKLGAECNIELLGIDFADTAIDRAKSLLPAATFMREDIFNNRLPAGSFDLVLSIETLEHLKDPDGAVKELIRFCKKGGNIVITVPNGAKDTWDGHLKFWDINQFRAFLQPYGLVEARLMRNDTTIIARLTKND